jgi:16S rRNA (cytidine1402-2'-O)-methyltransferase
MDSGILYIVATPIGNLGDISERAVSTLRAVDLILCEDTRVTKNLLDHFGISTRTLSYHQHSDAKKIKEIQLLLQSGKNIALVTDAGMLEMSVAMNANGDIPDVLVNAAASCKNEL